MSGLTAGNVAALVTVLTALVGALAGAYRYFAGREDGREARYDTLVERTIRDLRTDLDAQRAELAHADRRQDELETTIGQLRMELLELRGDRAQIVHSYNLEKAKNAELTEEVAQLKARVAELERRNGLHP